MASLRNAAILSFLFLAPVDCVAANLTLMAEDAAEPFSRSDGTGYANDLVKAAFHASSVEVAFDVVPYARCKKDAEDGKIAGCFSMSWYKGVENAVVFADLPVIQVHADIFVNRNAPARAARLEDFKPGAVVGIVNEYEYPDAIYRLRQQGVTLRPAPNDGANLKMLGRGRLDAAIVMTNDLVPEAQKAADAGVAGAVAYAFRGGFENGYVGFSKKNPRGAWALAAFQRRL